jgi:hypothetical protein
LSTLRVEGTLTVPTARGLRTAQVLAGEVIRFCRLVESEQPPGLPVRLHFSPHGGNGDRVVFQGIVRHAMQVEGQDARVIAVGYRHQDYYGCKDYAPRSHEQWLIDSPTQGEAREADIAREMCRVGPLLFPGAPSTRVRLYGGPSPAVEGDPSISCVEMYTHYSSTLAPLEVYPRFELTAEAELRAREELDRLCPPGAPRVALHARQQKIGEEKNLAAADLRELAVRLRQKGYALVLFCDDPPPQALQELCCHTCPQTDPLLQLPAALLKHCDALVGGDSGPGHLAAAVGTPVVSIRRAGDGWVNGPFCPADRLAVVEGQVARGEAGPSLGFDVQAAAERLDGLLARRGGAAPSSRVPR